MVTRVLVALGSNVGDRLGYIREATARLEQLASGRIESSSIYFTDPQDMEDDAEEFANAAVAFDTALPPKQLLAGLQRIEEELGRPGDHAHHVSRTIDLDIIVFGEETIDEADLKVPHPRAHERLFVLMPLVELAPDVRLGTRTVRQWLVSALSGRR